MRLTILGGGGLRTPLFIYGLAQRDRDLFDVVTLYDVDERRLQLLGQLCRFIVEQNGDAFQLHLTSDLAEALSQADFVFSAIRVGQDDGRVIDEQIPLQYGVLGQETTGPGGFAMALRTIPIMREYARAIKTYSPNAWLLNFTNPAGIITQSLLDIGIKTVGICDSPSGMKRRLARFLGVSTREVDIDYFGLNHLGWISDIVVSGEDRLADILDRYEELSALDAEFAAFDPDWVRQLGCLPNEYLHYYYSASEAVEHIVSSGSSRAVQIRDLNRDLLDSLTTLIPNGRYTEALELYQRVMGKRSQSYMQRETTGHSDGRRDLQSEEVFSGGYEEVALDVIRAIRDNDPTSLVLNVANRGTIRFLDDNDVVEVSTVVSGRGMRPLVVPRIPAACASLMVQVKEYERLTIEAAVSGDTGKAEAALCMHPLVPTMSIARRLFQDYLREGRGYLPQFQ